MAKKHTGRALLASGLSLLVSVALLLGITFAWFTDSVTSGRNTITAGNLDVELYHTNATVADEKVTGDTHLFTGENGEDVLWEPGAMAYENFKVVNEGTLALFYRLAINVFNSNTIAGTGQSLADVIRVAVVDGVFNGEREEAEKLDFTSTLAGFAKTGALTQQQDSDTYAVVLYWEPSAADNEYNLGNGKLSSDGNPLFIELGVELNATQTPYESDSFGDQYDENADETVAITSGTGHVLNQDITVVKPNGVGVNVAGQGTEVTIAGGTVNGGSGGNNVGVWAQPGSTVNITGGTFTVGADASGSGNSVVYSTGGVINISGGFFYTNTAYNGKYYVLNLQNGSGGQIHVTGGTFVNFDPSNGDDVDPGSFVEDGYTVVAEQQPNGDTWYTVVKSVNDPTSLREAIEQGESVQLSTTLQMSEPLIISEDSDVTIFLNGNDLVGTNAGSFLVNRGTLTLNGDENSAVYTTDTQDQGRHAVENYGILTINGGTYGSDLSRGNAVRNFGTATINGGTFTACDNYVNGGYAYAIANGDANHRNANMVINDATVSGSMNGAIASDGGKLIINGGSYTLGTGMENNLFYMVYTSGFGEVEINGGTFIRDVNNDHGFFNVAGVGGIRVNGGSFTDLVNGHIKGIGTEGTVTIYGGEFDGEFTGTSISDWRN